MAHGVVKSGVVVVCLATTLMLLSLPTSDARQSGPPVDEVASLCTNMEPLHGFGQQTSPAPYIVKTSHTCYTPGQAVTGKNV